MKYHPKLQPKPACSNPYPSMHFIFHRLSLYSSHGSALGGATPASATPFASSLSTTTYSSSVDSAFCFSTSSVDSIFCFFGDGSSGSLGSVVGASGSLVASSSAPVGFSSEASASSAVSSGSVTSAGGKYFLSSAELARIFH